MKRGIIYILYHSNPDIQTYDDLLDHSIASLRKNGYDGPISIVTEPSSMISPPDISVIRISEELNDIVKKHSRPFSCLKTHLNTLTPYDRTMYLDCDMIAVGPFDNLWNVTGFGMVEFIVEKGFPPPPLFGYMSDEERQYNEEYFRDKTFRNYNSGLMLWDDNDSPFWAAAQDEYEKCPGYDEPVLSRAMDRTSIYPAPLASRYNCSRKLEANQFQAFLHLYGEQAKYDFLHPDRYSRFAPLKKSTQ